MRLRVVNDPAALRRLVAAGFCPVECALGAESLVDGLAMDHHGAFSHLEAVSIRAYRDHFGARAEDPRFVVTGAADADATFAVAALAGLLPHPARAGESAGLSEECRSSLTRDLMPLAETIALMDTAPIGRDPSRLPMGELLLLWHTVRGPDRDDPGFAAGVGLWRALTEAAPETLNLLAAAAVEQARQRRERAWTLLEKHGELLAPGVLFISTTEPGGPADWYGRIEANPLESPEGWRHAVVIAHQPEQGKVTLACPNQAVAETLFGPGGLKNLYPRLGAGWGGRESIGGSPRGERVSVEQARAGAGHVVPLMLNI